MSKNPSLYQYSIRKVIIHDTLFCTAQQHSFKSLSVKLRLDSMVHVADYTAMTTDNIILHVGLDEFTACSYVKNDSNVRMQVVE